eukprot:15448177-Alexandrium_andersonii.AAC.1
MQGWWRHHEDIFIVKPRVQGVTGVGAFAVLDGHGGARAARAAAGFLEMGLADLAKKALACPWRRRLSRAPSHASTPESG